MENTWFLISSKLKKIDFCGDADDRFTEEFAKRFILKYTKRGDRILDPFAGFGTTLLVSQRLGRRAIGVEFEKSKCEYVGKRLRGPNRIINGDSMKIGSYELPMFDFSISSPPFMTYFDQEDPFTGYKKPGSYSKYLKDIGRIYGQIKKMMKTDATVIIEASNTIGDEGHPMTPLAWDIGREISKLFFFEKEIIYCSTEGDHSHVLVFKNR